MAYRTGPQSLFLKYKNTSEKMYTPFGVCFNIFKGYLGHLKSCLGYEISQVFGRSRKRQGSRKNAGE